MEKAQLYLHIIFKKQPNNIKIKYNFEYIPKIDELSYFFAYNI